MQQYHGQFLGLARTWREKATPQSAVLYITTERNILTRLQKLASGSVVGGQLEKGGRDACLLISTMQ